MTRQVFIKQLEDLNHSVIKMGSLLELSMNEMITALKTLNTEMAETIIDRDDEIDKLEQSIQRDCIDIIAKQQPLASDLRQITSIMKIITDVERIADHCADISEYIISLNQKPTVRAPKHLEEMVLAMKKMVIGTIDSFVSSDYAKTEAIIAADDEVDRYFEIISNEITELMQSDADSIPQGVCYIMIIKYLERMADHATNIAEWIQFIITGELVIG